MKVLFITLVAGLAVAGCSSSDDSPATTPTDTGIASETGGDTSSAGDTGSTSEASADETSTDETGTSSETGSESGGDAGSDAKTDGGPVTCGGVTCAAGQFCNYKTSAACGTASSEGTCLTPPMICGGVIATVCGCDGKEYDNACNAHAASVAVKHDGHCP